MKQNILTRRGPAGRSLRGALAGLVATAPMTGVMLGLKQLLPPIERFPLPPRRITLHFAAAGHLLGRLPRPLDLLATLLLHFGFGATAGAVYAWTAARVRLPWHGPHVRVAGRRVRLLAVARGMAFGLLVWAVSYVGWLPALGIIAPAQDRPRRRNLLMITAHLVWGACAGLLVDAFTPRRRRQGGKRPAPAGAATKGAQHAA